MESKITTRTWNGAFSRVGWWAVCCNVAFKNHFICHISDILFVYLHTQHLHTYCFIACNVFSPTVHFFSLRFYDILVSVSFRWCSKKRQSGLETKGKTFIDDFFNFLSENGSWYPNNVQLMSLILLSSFLRNLISFRAFSGVVFPKVSGTQ